MGTASHLLFPYQEQSKPTNKADIEHLANAAWNFAHTILWAEQTFSKQEMQRTMEHLHSYFEESRDKKKAFVIFCERIVITDKFITGHANRYLPNPAIWFNWQYEHGFAGTLNWYKQIQNKRVQVQGYMQHLTVIAENYYEYIQKPSQKVFKKCRKKLLELKAKSLLQHFYNTIIHFNYSTF